MKLPTRSMDVKAETEKPFPAPFKSLLGKTDLRGLSRNFELSQFAIKLNEPALLLIGVQQDFCVPTQSMRMFAQE